nr:hypothetical protein GCM10010200_045300 [Actinomadura rugatobispora]
MVAISAFMITMDNTVVANALPTMIRELDMSNSAKDWVATGYILMFSCLMIAGGRLTDVYGCRVTFTTGMVVFTLASAVCGLAPDDMVLILGRIVQGAGAALALPATLVMVTVGRTDKQRSLGTIVWVGAASGATALGPTIGGIIVSHWPWGWIFLINIPAGILVIILGLVVLNGKGDNADARVDLPGVLISATLLFALAYGLETGRVHGWGDPSVLAVFALAAIALVCFIVVETWAPDPMMNLRFFRNRVFVGGLLSQMLWGIGFNGMVFYSATFLQTYLGFSPPKAGLVMLPSAVAVMVTTPVAFWLAGRVGPRAAVGGGMAAMAFGMVLFSMLRRDDGFAELMPGVLIVGIGSAMCMPLAMYVLKAVPDDQAGLASGILNVIREVSGAFGIAIVGLLIHEVPRQDAGAAELEAFRHGTASGLIIGAVLVLIGGMISAVTLPSRRGWFGPKHGRQGGRRPAAPARRAAAPRPAQPVPASIGADGGGGGVGVLVAEQPAEPAELPAPEPYEPEPHPDLLSSFRRPWEGLAVTTSGPAYTGPPRYPAYPAPTAEETPPVEEKSPPPPPVDPVTPLRAAPPPAGESSRTTRPEHPIVKPDPEGEDEPDAWRPPPPPKGWYHPYVPDDTQTPQSDSW